MFSASLTRTGKWKVKEISYSRQEIVENESQMPLDICFIDDLSIANQSPTVCFFFSKYNDVLMLTGYQIDLE